MKKEKYLRKIALIVTIMILIFTIKVQAIEKSSITISFDRANGGTYSDSTIEMISGTTATFNIEDSYSVSTGNSSIGVYENNGKTVRASGVGETTVTVKPVASDSTESPVTYTLKVYDSTYQTIEEAKANSGNDEKILNEIRSGLVSANVTKDYFSVAKSKNSIPLQIKSNSEGKVVWTFNSITNTNIDLKTDVTVSKKAEAPKAIFLKFSHSGNIPGKANVEINVGTDVFGTSSATGLYLFTYNESTQMCKKVLPVNTYSNGKITLVLDEQTIASSTSYVVFFDANNIEIGKEVSLPKTENNDILNQIKAGPITAEKSATASIAKDYFEVAKKNNEDITITIPGLVTWNFASITNTSTALKPYVQTSTTKFSSIKSNEIKDAVFMDFSHSGNLPGKAKVSVNIGTSKFGTGSKTLYLYYYNPSKSAYEFSCNVQYSNGTATFELTHCSSYAIAEQKLATVSNTTTNETKKNTVVNNTATNNTTKALDNEPKTGEDSWIGFSVMLAIVSLGIAIITKK